jgi:hypothetical protein
VAREREDEQRAWSSALVVFGSIGLTFALPFVGPLLAAGAWIISAAWGRRVWPRTSGTARIAAGVAAALVVWLPLFIAATPAQPLVPTAYMWLMLPLCGPATLAGWVIPSAGALALYGAGSLASVALGRVWLWPAAALAAIWAYEASSYLLGVETLC